jgi:predicted transposase/invertase (TIGR01784 family)
MPQELANPHDAFFKAVFSNLARSRQFFRSYLPEQLLRELDLEVLQLEKGSFVDLKLRQRHSDLLFRTLLKSGHEAWLYLLFEHQSTPESLMPFRLLQYLVRIWEQHREQRPGDHPLPGIVPVVLYHGTVPWRAPLFFSKLLDLPVDLGIHPPELEYLLIDLSRIPDQLLRDRLELELSLSLLRHIRDENFLDFFQQMVSLLAELRLRKTGLEYLETILRYVYYSRSEDEWDDLVDLLRQSDPVIQEVAMTTIAEHLINKGKAAGLEQGIEQGIEEGKLFEAHDVLLEDLEEQFGQVPPRLAEKVRQIQNRDTLRMLRRQRKTCRTLDEFDHLLEKGLH